MSATLSKTATKPARYGMTIDLDRCTGCGACMIACAVENNVPPARPEATPGIVDQMPQRCLGCRYCMAACPYHARYFNWWDPQWPPGMEKTLNPDGATRMRGVVEKCNFCHGRLQAARARAAAVGRRELRPGEYVPACVEACPAAAIVFGDLDDPASEVAGLSRDGHAFRILERLGTEPKIYYRTARPWVRQAAAQPHAESGAANPGCRRLSAGEPPERRLRAKLPAPQGSGPRKEPARA